MATALELELGDLPVSETYDEHAKQGGRPLKFRLSASATMCTLTRRRPMAGMSYVIVNGTPVIDNGELDTKAGPGKPIRRTVTA